MAQRQQREASDEWELVAANEVHTIDALKQEGNALFQRQRYIDAIQVYARALMQLPPVDAAHLTREDVESLENLEVAVRLNRALAYLELQDANLLAYADEDCSVALARQPLCVKAFYRRALARERLGRIKDALSDVEHMHALEPANPAALQLMARLQEAYSCQQTRVEPVESELSAALKEQCSLSKQIPEHKPAHAAVDAPTVAHDVWKALQDEEKRIRDEVFKQSGAVKSRASGVTHKKTRAKARPADGVCREKSAGDEVRTKTDSTWAALLQEETSTVENIYKKKIGAATHTTTMSIKTNSSASIHPSR